MTITVDSITLNLSAEYAEYLDLMCSAVVKPGDPPIESLSKMVEKILLDNYASNIQQHATVRPKKVAEQFKSIELEAGTKIGNLITSTFTS